MVKSTIKSAFRLSSLVNGLSESHYVPSARQYVRRDIEADSKNEYHRLYYHSVLAYPRLSLLFKLPKPVVLKPIKLAVEVKKAVKIPSVPDRRLCPDCGKPLEMMNSGCSGWSCNNDRCLVTKVVFNHRFNGRSRCITGVTRATIL